MKTRNICLAMLMASMSTSLSAQVIINVDANNQGPAISPTHYGIFYEDINHAADGILNLANCQIDVSAPNAVALTRLSSASGDDENTLQNPRAIYPTQAEAKAADPRTVKFHVPAFSMNILKLQLQ